MPGIIDIGNDLFSDAEGAVSLAVNTYLLCLRGTGFAYRFRSGLLPFDQCIVFIRRLNQGFKI